MKCEQEFVVMDDDDISNLIALKMIQSIMPGCGVQTFNDPQKAVNRIVAVM